ncbi:MULTISPECIES: cutinase family protein [Nocardia]|uniref:cutinase family protein n=1 Tax=Nocardia TaxID=1817 RepID=UPI0009ED679C|nr:MULTISPECIES: cutinase family protein [Nocardia]MBF6272924.1 cutinase family protein [Nocardia nova]
MTAVTLTLKSLATAAVSAACVAAVSGLGSGAADAVPIGPGCPALYVIGIQGTGQSNPDPTADTGVIGALLAEVQAAAPDLVQHSTIPYPAGFGGIVPGGGSAPYAESATEALAGLDAAATDITNVCPSTLLAGVAYSQGAQAMAQFAQQVGAGNGPVSPDKIAGIALYANPDRLPNSPVIPGRPGQTVPDPAPGTSGAAVAAVQILNPPASGSGIGTDGSGYGALAGRVADICTDGDLACSAPDHAALLRVGAEIAAQANLRDPIAALSSINELFSTAMGRSWTTVLAEDFHTDAINADYVPGKPLAQRLIDAADPRTPAPGPDQVQAAVQRWDQITAAATANPLGVVPKLAGQLAGAWGQLVADNADLINPAVWVRYGDTVARHNGYLSSGQLASGVAWMTALAHDAAGHQS